VLTDIPIQPTIPQFSRIPEPDNGLNGLSPDKATEKTISAIMLPKNLRQLYSAR